MDPLESVDTEKDTTYVLMCEAFSRGHEVIHLPPSGISCRQNKVLFSGIHVEAHRNAEQPFQELQRLRLCGENFDAVLIRTDPPFNQDYLYVTLLADQLPRNTFVMNDPEGIRDINEKMGPLYFSDLIPQTAITQSVEELQNFQEEVGGAIVLKPIDGHGGKGIVLIQKDDVNRKAVMSAMTKGGTQKVLGQEFLEATYQGDKRIILLDGKPIGAMLRKAQPPNFINNLMAGGRAYPATITNEDRIICDRLRPFLQQRGLHLTGIDIIGGKLMELNVTSPTCVQEIDRFDNVCLEKTIIDFVERKVEEKAEAANLKSQAPNLK